MTFGSGKCYKSGTGLAVSIPKVVAMDQGIEAGDTVQFDMRKLQNIPKREAKHFQKESI